MEYILDSMPQFSKTAANSFTGFLAPQVKNTSDIVKFIDN